MLGRYIPKDKLKIIADKTAVQDTYRFFLENEKFIIIVDDREKPIGIIHKEDVMSIQPSSKVAEAVKVLPIIVDCNTTIEEIDRTLFNKIKEKVNEIIVTNNLGAIEGVWDRTEPDSSTFYEKYAYIRQTGYSLVDWLYYYYGQNVTIGIHSYSVYTELLLREIENSNVEVKFICQGGGNCRGYKGEIKEKSFADVSCEELQACDLVINAFISLKEQVKYLYSKHKHYNKVKSLYDIVEELYLYEKRAGYMLRVASHIAASGRMVYIFDYPKLHKQNIKSERENELLVRNLCWQNLLKLLQSSDKNDLLLAEKLVMPALNKARTKEIGITFEDYINYFPSTSAENLVRLKHVGNNVVMYDMSSRYINISSGMRKTFPYKDMEGNKTKRIHFWGKSWVFGHNCADEYTFPSFVQKISNENNLKYKVYNHGIPGIAEETIVNMMYDQNEKLPKDEIFVLVHMFEDGGNKYNKKVALECGFVNELSSERPHEYGEIWVDSGHIGEDGSELLAKQIVDAITGNGKVVPREFRNKFNPNAGKKIYHYEVKDQAALWADSADFKEYKKYIARYKQKIGAIVMNCNPFTLGHRYLIENASEQCDKLYVFIVEEDKSIFPFADRMRLVEQGTADLENVTVLHSGNFIISAMTFPGYFNKAVDNDVTVDTSDDLLFFVRYIAPTLGINVRYVGEEPIDKVTRQYNESMKDILPKYGIELVEISRKMNGESVISASWVRKLLSEGKMDEIAEIVPKTTLEYLMNKVDKKNDGMEI